MFLSLQVEEVHLVSIPMQVEEQVDFLLSRLNLCQVIKL
jgi:hypothetical protein